MTALMFDSAYAEILRDSRVLKVEAPIFVGKGAVVD